MDCIHSMGRLLKTGFLDFLRSLSITFRETPEEILTGHSNTFTGRMEKTTN